MSLRLMIKIANYYSLKYGFDAHDSSSDDLLNEKDSIVLYHRATVPGLQEKNPGDSFILKPGMQGAEGIGVYFSEGTPVKSSTAEGIARIGGQTGIIRIEVKSPSGWWRSKGAKSRKFGKPRTWHSDGKSLKLTIKDIGSYEGDLLLNCDWEFSSESDSKTKESSSATAKYVKQAANPKIYQCIVGGVGICRLHGMPTKQTICPECKVPTKEIINPTPAQLQAVDRPVEPTIRKVYKCTNTGSDIICPMAGVLTKNKICGCGAKTVEITNPTPAQIQAAYGTSTISKPVSAPAEYHPIQNQIKNLMSQISSALSTNHPNKNEIAKIRNFVYRLAGDAWQAKKPLFQLKAQYSSLKQQFDAANAKTNAIG